MYSLYGLNLFSVYPRGAGATIIHSQRYTIRNDDDGGGMLVNKKEGWATRERKVAREESLGKLCIRVQEF